MTATLQLPSATASTQGELSIAIPPTWEERKISLQNEISELEEFLYDDFGDTVAQLGIEKTRELETKLATLQDALSAMYAAD